MHIVKTLDNTGKKEEKIQIIYSPATHRNPKLSYVAHITVNIDIFC